ncbi:MAG TPA: ribonuclease P protein component [Flavobacteriaceae bacterium]|nr:ribonuclease P protein component [Flavobacteriaceae bacterium]
MSEQFGKNERIKSKKVFEKLFSEGKSINTFPLKLVFVPLEVQEEKLNKIGVSAPKKRFKKAVERNKIKRLMRESFRKNKYILNNTKANYALLFIYIGKEIMTYSQIFASMEKLLRKFVEQEKSTKK